MSIFHQHVDLVLALPMCTVIENPCVIIRFLHRLIINISCVLSKMLIFLMEKCRSGAKKGLLHYVLRRDLLIVAKSDHFELEICAKARGGRTARCIGDVPVAEMLASEARQPPHAGCTRGGARSVADDPTYCLFAGERSRESCGTWQLPQNIRECDTRVIYCFLIIKNSAPSRC